ncbi:MAG: aminotransferase class V-fold PLP-dependent enzyme [Propionicimonas sp.]|uniref:pyridoxal phosphate-dependent decarboxylase family protein n=1 Tax=Propionicimonas sp. TaxID=1955623 RepID=UPI003D0DC364
MSELHEALEVAHRLALDWLDSLPTRDVPGRAAAEDVAALLGDLPDHPSPAPDVVRHLAAAVEPGLTAMASPRWFGMVIGGTHPAALAADWLTSAWDQNSALEAVTPGTVAVEHVVDAWLLDLLGLPADSGVGLVTGATMANWTCLVAARDAVLRRADWDTAVQGLSGSPAVRVLVGDERHDSVDSALRFAGLGRPEPVASDDQGRIDVDALAWHLDRAAGAPAIVVLQAGNVHSGAFDDFPAAIAVAHRAGAWVHVDGAFGLFASASPRLRHLVEGCAAADSWTTDAHKTLNVPYDCGIAIVRDDASMRASMGMRGEYLIQDEAGGDPFDRVPEMSRRARAVPVWAVLAALGRSGVAELVERFCRHATMFAEGIRAIPGAEVLNDVVFTQVCARFGSDERTREVVRDMLADGKAWTSGSRWHDRAVLRVALCNGSTTDEDVEATLAVLRRVAG